jgi:hypothetical protein
VRSSRQTAITPVWAQRIEVERRSDALLITGWGHIPNPLSSQRVPPEKRSKLDILQGLRRYALRQLGQPRDSAGVYQFADCTSDDKLIAFAQEFGPVCGTIKEFKPESNGLWTLTVRETLKNLRHEQKQFAALVGIVQQVNRNAHADFGVLGHLLTNLEMDMAKTYDWFRAMEDLASQGLITSKSADLLPMAHSTLCLFFNNHPPKLVPVDGEVMELPDVDFTGIRNAIYYQLRRDYLAQREIGTCLECGNHFSVFKHGSRGCSDPCRRALRNRTYWSKHKQTINRKRRTKDAEGK